MACGAAFAPRGWRLLFLANSRWPALLYTVLLLFTSNALPAQPLLQNRWHTPVRVSPTPSLPRIVAASRAGDPGVSNDRWFGRDKWLHAAVAASLQFTAYAFMRAQGASRGTSQVGATLFTGAASVGKEWHDARAGGAFSRRDLVWDAVGAAAGSATAHQVDR